MEDPSDPALAQLQSDWPNWEVWIVGKAIGGITWCARRRDDHKRVLNAGSADELAEYLEDTVSDAPEGGGR